MEVLIVGYLCYKGIWYLLIADNVYVPECLMFQNDALQPIFAHQQKNDILKNMKI